MTSDLRRGELFALLLALSGCATAPASRTSDQVEEGVEPRRSTPSTSGEDCLFQQFVDDWMPVDAERLLIFGNGRREAFLAQLATPVPSLPFDWRIAIADIDRNGRICGFSSDAVVFAQGSIPDRVTIRSMRRIDKVEADALLESAARQRSRIPPVQDPKDGAPRQ